MSRITLMIGMVLVAGITAHSDGQCCYRVRARCGCYVVPSCCPVPSCRPMCDPCSGYPQVTTKPFGYRAPFGYGYPAETRRKPTLAVPKPAPEPLPAVESDQGHSAESTTKAADAPAKIAVPDAEPAKLMTIVETAEKAGVFTKLLAYAKKAHLLEDVTGGPFTIFAPTDEAFAKLDPQIAQRLDQDEAFLRQVLRHLAAPTDCTANKLLEMQKIAPFSGEALKIEQTAEGLTVDGIRVEKPDVLCTDGIVHIIGTVLLPAESEQPDASEDAPPAKE